MFRNSEGYYDPTAGQAIKNSSQCQDCFGPGQEDCQRCPKIHNGMTDQELEDQEQLEFLREWKRKKEEKRRKKRGKK